MLITHKGNDHVMHGDSLLDVANWLNSTPRKWIYNHSRTNTAASRWDFSVGYEGAWKLAHDGWSEGAKDIADKLDALPRPVNSHPVLRYDMGGYMPDIARYLSNDPACMISGGKVRGKKPVVHMITNIVCSAAVRSEEFANYGAALAVVVDMLEAKGIRVELDVCAVHSLKGNEYSFGWKVKQAGEALDLGALAFSLAHPAAFRRIGFAMCERSPKWVQSPGYGACSIITQQHAALMGADDAWLLQGIGHAPGVCSTLDGAVKYMVNLANSYAGEEIISLEAA